MNIRKPYVAGQFYPSSQVELHEFLRLHIDTTEQERDAYVVIMPHAGYIYSGETAAHTIACVKMADTVVLLGPNHTGVGAPFSLMGTGSWVTPLGDILIDEELAQKMINECTLIKDDVSAHEREHSLEVQLPFLQYRKSDVKIVPLTVGSSDLKSMRMVAESLARILEGRNTLILVSSDMTHYESKVSAEAKDKRAIEAIEQLDETMLANVVSEYNISMCGFAPTYIALIIAKQLGAHEGKLVEYTTSAAVTGDEAQVVGYAGIIIT